MPECIAITLSQDLNLHVAESWALVLFVENFAVSWSHSKDAIIAMLRMADGLVSPVPAVALHPM
eukprot:248714-Amphidinium_carterae.1